MRGLKDYIPKIRRAFVNRLPTLVEEEREESTKRKKEEAAKGFLGNNPSGRKI